MKKSPYRLPKHLTAKTKTWAAGVIKEYDLSPTQFELLVMAAEQRDLAESSREKVAQEGGVINDRFGQAKENPHAKLQRDAAVTCSRLLREIGLAHDDSDENRPPRVGGD